MASLRETDNLAWKKKVEDYKKCGVWEWFKDLRQITWAKVGDGNSDLANEYTEAVVDEWLRRKRSGEPVVLPDKVDIDKVGSGFVDMGRFVQKQEDDFFRDAMWVYHHLGAAVDPESAPTSGAYFWLCELRENAEARKSFMVNIMPKLIKNEEEQRFKDDGRDQFEILGRLMAETPAVG